ncbi:MAG: hypothetical protein WCR66_04935 [Bacteroidota bacterium]
MNKITVLVFSILTGVLNTHAQKPTILKQVLTLHIEFQGGANGACVAWHPVQKKYYAAQAGNETFPMVVFDANGRLLSDDKLKTLADVRGFWYNPNTKTLQANCYDVTGWVEYKLNGKGIPASITNMGKDPGKPDAQSVGVYDPKKNVVYYFDYSTVGIERHKMSDGVSDTTFALHLGAKTKSDIEDDDQQEKKTNYNENTLIYTGIAGSEIGLLNVNDKQIELYNLTTGLMTKSLRLPDDAPIESSLNFSYCNGIYWLNDKKAHIWHGYNGN